MANSTARTGFKLAYNIYGKVEAQVLAYPAGNLRTGAGSEIFIGDVVSLVSGLVVPALGIATSGATNVLGVVVGVSAMPGNVVPTALNSMNAAPPFIPENLQQRSLPIGTSGWVYVIPAAGNVFSTINTTATTIAQIGALAALVGTAGTLTVDTTILHGVNLGSADYTGNSTHAISSGAATPGDCRIVGVYNNFPGTFATGQTDPSQVNGAVLVMIRNPLFTQ